METISESDTINTLNTAAQEIAWTDNKAKNDFDLPDALPPTVKMDRDFYNSLKAKEDFEVYTL